MAAASRWLSRSRSAVRRVRRAKAPGLPARRAPKPAAKVAAAEAGGRPAARRPRRSLPASYCARSPTKSATAAPTRSAMRACAKPKSARSPKRKRVIAPSANPARTPSAKPPRAASARKTIAASTTKKPSGRPTKSPRSASAKAKQRRARTPGARPVLEAEEEEGPRDVPPRPGRRRSPCCPRRSGRRAPRKTAEKAARPAHPGHRAHRRRRARAFRRVVPPPQPPRGARLSNEPKEKLIREVTIPEAITIHDLANRMAERSVDVIKLLMKQGQMATINDVIDADTAQLIAEELGHTVKRVAEADVEEGVFDVADDPAHLVLARAGRHRDGPRRPRQDLAARRDPLDRTSRPAKPAASPSTSAPIR